MKKTLSRRDFLLQAGGTTLALPLLPSLLPKAMAQTAGKPPKRFIAISHVYGHYVNHFFSQSTIPMTPINSDTSYGRLSDFQGPISRVFNSKYDPYRSKMNIYQGLDSVGGGGHNSTVPLTGGGYLGGEGEDSPPKFGRSIDTLIMRSPNVYNSVARFDAIRIGNTNLGVTWDRDANGVAKRLNYMVGNSSVFNTVFGNVVVGPQADTSNTKQKLIIDRIFERYVALRNNPRMSSADRQRFERHVASVTEVQKRIQSQGACSVPNFTPGTDSTPVETIWRNNIDVLVSAMSCDMTRVGVLNIMDFTPGTGASHATAHAVSHDREGSPAVQEISAGYSDFKSDQILYLLQKLSSIVESDGSTMLDNTVVLWTAELTSGQHHISTCLPLATFGSAGGALKTGYLMDFRIKPISYIAGRTDFNAPLGQPYNRLLITLMRAMGMQPSEYINEGDGGGFGEFKQDIQYIGDQYRRYLALRNDPLPIIFG